MLFLETEEKFENTAHLRSGLSSTVIRHENKAFRNRSSNWRILKTDRLFVFVWTENIKNGVFQKR